MLHCYIDLVSSILPFIPTSHGDITLDILDFCLFSQLAILVWLSTIFKPFQYVRKLYAHKENGDFTSMHD